MWQYHNLKKGASALLRRCGCVTEHRLTEGRLTERQITEGQITKDRITERRITEGKELNVERNSR